MAMLCTSSVTDLSMQGSTIQPEREVEREMEQDLEQDLEMVQENPHEGFQECFPVSTLMHHREVGAGEPYGPQEDVNTLILDIKTEPDLLDIHSFIYSDEHDDLPTSENEWDGDTQQDGDYTGVQCEDGLGTLTIIKEEPSEEELGFCAELQSNFKPESIEISIEEEEDGCDALLVEHEEVSMPGECSYLPSAKVFKSCSECGKMFPTSSSYNRHMRIHSGERPFQCSQCNKTFTQFSSFKIHQRIHTGEKPYHCSECEKTFSRLDALHLHQRTHTGEKPYKCSHCPKTFTRLYVLQNHLRTHTGIKPYQCSYCGKTFTRLCSFKIHKRRHTGEKPYACGTCGKQFVDASNLKNHLRTHTKERPYQCPHCDKTFIQLGHLTSHRRKSHTIEIVTVL